MKTDRSPRRKNFEADRMIKTSYNNYLDSLVGITDDSDSVENSRPNTKKLFFHIPKTVDKTVRVVHLEKKMDKYALTMQRRPVC